MPARRTPHHLLPPRLRALIRAAVVVTAAASVLGGTSSLARAGGHADEVAGSSSPVAPQLTRASSSPYPVTAARSDRQHVTLRSPASARTGSRVRFTGTVSPARAGLRVRVQRRYAGAWHTVASTRLAASGSWSATTHTPAARGWLRYRAVADRNGTLAALATRSRRVDNYTLHTYVVRHRGTIRVSMKDFAAQAADTYADARGWAAAHHRFAHVAKGGDFTLVMSEAKYLPTYSPVCSVRFSCRAGRYVVINQNRWRGGSPPFTGSLRDYRHMVVNHETGHWLGRHHAFCGGKEELAPVMQQQSKGLQGCRPNAWPLPSEIRAVAAHG